MFALVRAVLFDRGEQLGIFRCLGPQPLQNPIDRGVSAILVVDIDRGDQLEIATAKPIEHGRP
jgi:hypothetical protein